MSDEAVHLQQNLAHVVCIWMTMGIFAGAFIALAVVGINLLRKK